MTTFQFTLSSTKKTNGEKSIVIVFIKDRKNTSLSLRKYCNESQWSFEAERLKRNHPDYLKLNQFIDKYKIVITDIIDQYEEENKPYTLPDLINSIKTFKGINKTLSFTDFQNDIIMNLKNSDKIGSHRIENDTLKSLQKFFAKKEIGFNEINYLSLKKYEAFCLSRGNKPSTIGIRMRCLRSTFNQAIKGKIIKETQYPFKDYKISKIKSISKKEFLNQEEIALLKNYDPADHYENFAKAIFLFSYYSRGINYIDLLQLKKSEISKDTASYLRMKTGAPVSFKLNDFSKDVIKSYSSDDESIFLFNTLKNNNPSVTYLKNKSAKYLRDFVNPYLKTMMTKLNIKKNITYYCARHSFATALKFNNVSIDIIQEALGHKDINSTMSYLNTLPDTKLDKIIEDVLV